MEDLIQKINNDEWLSSFLRRYKLSPVSVFFIVFIINVTLSVSLALIFHSWFPTSTRRGFSLDYPTWCFSFLIQPMIVSFYFWLQSGIPSMFDDLINTGVFVTPDSTMEFISAISKKMRSPWFSRFAIFLGIISTIFFIFGLHGIIIPQHAPTWLSDYPLISIIISPTIFVSIYAFIMTLIDLYFSFSLLNRLLNKCDIQVELYHPDNAGGLGMIGRYLGKIGYLWGSVGVSLIIAIIYASNYDPFSITKKLDYASVLYLILYIFLAPLSFLLPMWSSHNAMKRYRIKLMQKLSSDFDRSLQKIMSNDIAHTNFNESADQLKLLGEIHKLIYKLPTWPVNLRTVRDFAGLFLSPFMLFVFSLLKEYLSKLLYNSP